MTEPWTPEDARRMAEVDAHYLLCPSTPEMCDGCKYALQRAEDRLAALAEAGRLAPNGTTEQFGIGATGRRVTAYTTEVVARSKAKEFCLPLFRRWVGPWLPADRAPAVSPEENDHV